MTVTVYSEGLCYCSVCAPADMDKEDVVTEVNKTHPSGSTNGWALANENFSTGEENGYLCECNGQPTRHWLLSC